MTRRTAGWWARGTSGATRGSSAHRRRGGHWEPQLSNLSGGLSDVDFVDATNGWAVGDNPYGWGEGANTCIERTMDGGQTWVPLFVASGAALSAVDFLDATTGWAAGRYGATEGEGTPALFSSTNGGFTWKRHALPKGAPIMTGLQFIDSSTGWAVGVSYDWETEIETGWALRTTDGGTTWTRVHGLDDALPTTVKFVDAARGYVAGDDGVWSTGDGGATWERVAGGYGATAVTAAGDDAWAAGGQFLTSTRDGAGDSAAPTTIDTSGPASWWRTPVRMELSASDIGGSGLAGTSYRVDGDVVWRAGSVVEVPAPSDHSNDGVHAVYYRSTDNAGNREQLEALALGIDTSAPPARCTGPAS